MKILSASPLVSIITVNYNSGSGLEKTIASISPYIKLLNAELIIIDGLSTDDSFKRLEKIKTLFSIFLSEKDFGIYDAMNKGVKHAKGEWVWFLNSGDLALKSCTLIAPYLLTKNQGYNLYYGDFNTNNSFISNQNLNLKELFRGMINQQTIFYKRELLDGFDPSYGLSADYAHLLKKYHDIKYKKINAVVVQYDLNGKSSSLDRVDLVKVWLQRLRAIRASTLRIDYKIYGILFSLSVILVKIFFPNLGSRIYRLKKL